MIRQSYTGSASAATATKISTGMASSTTPTCCRCRSSSGVGVIPIERAKFTIACERDARAPSQRRAGNAGVPPATREHAHPCFVNLGSAIGISSTGVRPSDTGTSVRHGVLRAGAPCCPHPLCSPRPQGKRGGQSVPTRPACGEYTLVGANGGSPTTGGSTSTHPWG